MKSIEKHEQTQEHYEEGVFLLARSFSKMKSILHKILSMLRHSKHVENKIERIFNDVAHSGIQIDKKTHLLSDFYRLLSKAKTAQGEARNILLHFKLRENHEIIEQAFRKFRESYSHTIEAQKILKKMTKKNLLK